MAADSLFNTWAKRNPEFETKYDKLFHTYCEYGKGTNDYSASRAKILGAGYELYIIAFFIGLYAAKTKPLVEDPTKRKSLGQPIQFWGQLENRKLRVSYTGLKDYIFIALVAKADIDYITLDKGEISVGKVASMLIDKMEEYANYGLDYIDEQLENDSNWLSRNSSLLNLFVSFVAEVKESADPNTDIEEENEAESLD